MTPTGSQASPFVEEPAGRFGDALDVRLHYHDIGEGPVIVWLHGAGPGASAWGNFAGNVPAFPDYRNLLIDQPLFGASDKPIVHEPRITYNAERVVALLRNVGVERAHFVGNSMGGAVATKIAVDHPELVERLVVMGGAGVGPVATPTPESVPEALRLLLEVWKDGPTRENVERLLRLFVYDASQLDDTLIEARYRASCEPDAVRAHRESTLVTEDLGPELGRVEAPTLLLWGREDPVIPLEAGVAYLRGIPDARLVVFPRCGHWVQYEQREAFDRVVRDFLEDK